MSEVPVSLEPENPIMASMLFADRAYLILNRVNRVLTGAIGISLFIISLVALYVTRSFLPLYLLPGFITIPLGVLVFAVLASLTIYYGFVAKRMLRAWVQKFSTFSYLVRFETSPIKGKTPPEKILNQLLESVPDVGDPLKEFLTEHPDAVTDFLNVHLRRTQGTDIVDVCLRHEQVTVQGVQADRVRRALSRHGLVLAKYVEKKESVDERDLMTLRSHFMEALNVGTHLPFLRTKINRILVVSPSAFTDSAKEYVEDRRNWLGGKALDLIEERPKGYTVVSAIT